MDLSLRPLTTPPDAGRYVQRATIDDRLRHALTERANICVLGPRGAGKTSSVMQAVHATGVAVAIVNGAVTPNAPALLDAIGSGLSPFRPAAERAEQLARLEAAGDSLSRRADALAMPNAGTVVVDNLDDQDLALDVFGRLRDELWSTGIAFVIIAEPEAAPVFLRAPADAFFDVRCPIGPMSFEEQRSLLMLRGAGTLDAAAVDVEPRLARAVISRARAMADAKDGADPAAAAQLTAQRMSTSHAHLLEVVRSLRRPVSAGDEELQSVVGVSRVTAARLLRDLADAGILDSYDLRDGKPGRPARTYALTDPALAS